MFAIPKSSEFVLSHKIRKRRQVVNVTADIFAFRIFSSSHNTKTVTDNIKRVTIESRQEIGHCGKIPKSSYIRYTACLSTILHIYAIHMC